MGIRRSRSARRETRPRRGARARRDTRRRRRGLRRRLFRAAFFAPAPADARGAPPPPEACGRRGRARPGRRRAPRARRGRHASRTPRKPRRPRSAAPRCSSGDLAATCAAFPRVTGQRTSTDAPAARSARVARGGARGDHREQSRPRGSIRVVGTRACREETLDIVSSVRRPRREARPARRGRIRGLLPVFRRVAARVEMRRAGVWIRVPRPQQAPSARPEGQKRRARARPPPPPAPPLSGRLCAACSADLSEFRRGFPSLEDEKSPPVKMEWVPHLASNNHSGAARGRTTTTRCRRR